MSATPSEYNILYDHLDPDKPDLKLRLTLIIKYLDGRRNLDELEALMAYIVSNAANNGLMTGETAALVYEYDYKVEAKKLY